MTTLTEQVIPDDNLTALPDGQIQVREATVILKDGVRDPLRSPIYSRYVLAPGDDLTGKAARIVAMATALWTSDVVAAYAAAHPSS